jgi:hypothetical protein
MMAKKVNQEKMLEDPKGNLPEAHKGFNYIYSGLDSYESRSKQKLTAREVMVVSPAIPEYPKWSEVSITFYRSDHPNFIQKSCWYPLIASPIVKDVKLNRVLVNGGNSLNILFLKTFNQMGFSRSALCSNWAPFHRIVSGAAATPISQITLPVTFGTWENIHPKYMWFEVADLESAYNAFLGRPTVTKLMAIPHYAY